MAVVSGPIFDVAADIRQGSPTFWSGVRVALSDMRHDMVYVLPGFAHSFCVLSSEATVIYKISEEFSPDRERGFI